MIIRGITKKDFDYVVSVFDSWWVGPSSEKASPFFFHELGEHALIAEEEDGRVRSYDFATLAAEVARLANALRRLGVQPGDRVACYLPMIAEVVTAMLATHAVGAVFIPIFSGYAPPAVRERLTEAIERELAITEARSN